VSELESPQGYRISWPGTWQQTTKAGADVLFEARHEPCETNRTQFAIFGMQNRAALSRACITEANTTQFALFGVQNRAFGPYSMTSYRILVSAMACMYPPVSQEENGFCFSGNGFL
jgi:hypothetical protein